MATNGSRPEKEAARWCAAMQEDGAVSEAVVIAHDMLEVAVLLLANVGQRLKDTAGEDVSSGDVTLLICTPTGRSHAVSKEGLGRRGATFLSYTKRFHPHGLTDGAHVRKRLRPFDLLVVARDDQLQLTPADTAVLDGSD